MTPWRWVLGSAALVGGGSGLAIARSSDPRWWLSTIVEIGAYVLAGCFVLFLFFMAWMVLEDILEKQD